MVSLSDRHICRYDQKYPKTLSAHIITLSEPVAYVSYSCLLLPVGVANCSLSLIVLI
jgi:hypothetical protein